MYKLAYLIAALPVTCMAQVTISPAYIQAVPGQVVNFAAAGGPVIWQVNNAVGGNAASGTISAGGVFTAPASLPSPAAVTVTAVSAANPAQISTATITLLAQPVSGTTYYVATNGNDTNPGTQGAPFATLQHASTVAMAGDTVLVRQGVYNALFTPTGSGSTAKGPITYASYPGELATIDGTGLPIPGGQNGLITLSNLSYVVVEGFEIRNYTTAKTTQVPLGVYIQGAGSGVQIVNNHIHNITTTAKTTPKKCASDAFGLAAYGTAAPASINGLVISGNEVDHLLTGCSETVSVDGNVDGYMVTSNLVHDDNNIGIANIGFEKLSPDPAYDQARNGEVRGNTVYNITSYGNPDYGKQYAADGIYVDGGTQIVIEQNRIYATDLAIEMASEHKGRLSSYVTARNNLIYLNNSNGISIGGYGAARGGSDHITAVNNSLYNNDTKNTGSGEFQIQYYATNNIFENNIVYAGPQGLFVNNFTKSEADPATLDYNIYYGTIGNGAALFRWDGAHEKGFAKYVAASQQDARSEFTDPLYISLTTPNLDLQPGSPALNAGVNLGAAVVGNVDFAGNPRVNGNGAISIGAYQQ